MALSPRPAPVFLDKDGTLVQNVPYNVDPDRIALVAGGEEAVRLLGSAGHPLYVVSNQSGVARGYFAEGALAAVEARLRDLLRAAGADLAGMLWCPHHPEGVVEPYACACDCRKPAPGLILEAARRAGSRPEDCWMVGDILDDVEAGNRAGARTIFICPGGETEWRTGPLRTPTRVAGSLLEASKAIVASSRRLAVAS